MKNISDIGERHEPETATGQSREKVAKVAWLAGILDGEGTIGVTMGGKKSKTIQPRMAIGNTSLRLLAKCQQIIEELTGERYSMVQRATTKTAKNPIFIIEIAKQKVLWTLFNEMLPYLTVKAEQAKEVIAFCESRSRKLNYHSGFTVAEKELPEKLKRLKKQEFTPWESLVETKRDALH